ncbi:MAG: CarD family transcriptional regulator, partial [Alloalcanivorax venustensis]
MTLLPDTPLFPTGQDHYKDWQGLSDGSLAAVLAEVARAADGPLLVAAPDSSRAQQLADALGFYLAGNPGAAGEVPVMLFPDWETLPYDLFSPHQDIVSDRIRVLNWLHGATTGVLVVPVNTLMQRIAPPLHISGNSFMLRVGETFDMETTRARLVGCGFRQRDNVYEHGEFAVRGAIMDVFPMGSEQPFRVELFDQDIESLRLFDPESQRSTGQVSEINLLPAAEYPLSAEGIRRFRTAFRETFDVDPRKVPLYQDVSEGIATPGLEYYLPLFFDNLATLFDYLPGKARAVEMAGCEEAAQHFWDEVSARHESRRHDIRRPVLPPTELFLRPDQLNSAWQTLPRARQKDSDQAVRFHVEVPPTVSADAKARNPLAPLHTFADAHPDTRILVVAETAGRREALLEMMQKIGIQPVMKEGWAHFINEPDRWALTRGELDAGFYAPDHELLVVTESELYGERVMQRRRRRTSEESGNELGIRTLGEISPGAAVVHLDHGVGRYQGLVHMEVDRQQHEFLLLEYAGGDKLYVPVSSLHLISRYGGADNPPLNRLGTEQWTKARQKAAEKIHDVAAELLNTYARREARQGRAFAVEAEDYERFAAGFPFEETPDQESAIRAVLSDMQLAKPMDRLV